MNVHFVAFTCIFGITYLLEISLYTSHLSFAQNKWTADRCYKQGIAFKNETVVCVRGSAQVGSLRIVHKVSIAGVYDGRIYLSRVRACGKHDIKLFP